MFQHFSRLISESALYEKLYILGLISKGHKPVMTKSPPSGIDSLRLVRKSWNQGLLQICPIFQEALDPSRLASCFSLLRIMCWQLLPFLSGSRSSCVFYYISAVSNSFFLLEVAFSRTFSICVLENAILIPFHQKLNCFCRLVSNNLKS